MEVADADRRIDPGARDRRHDRAREVALFEDADPGAGGGHIGDQLLVAGPLEDGYGQVLNSRVTREGDPPKVVGHLVVEVDRPAGAGSGDELLHLGDGRQPGETTRFHGDEHRDGVDVAPRHLACPFHRVDAQVHGPLAVAYRRPLGQGRVVPRAEDDLARDARVRQRLAHGLAGSVADTVRAALAQEDGARKRRRLGCLDELERKLGPGREGRNTASLL